MRRRSLNREHIRTFRAKVAEVTSRLERLEQAQAEERVLSQWRYLVERRHRWRRQLSLKGRNMTAAQLVATMKVNAMTAEQAAADFAERRLLITHNCRDFEHLHRQFVNHPGIVGIYRDNDASRDMTYGQIVASLRKLESSGMPLENTFHVLNVWR